MSHKSILSQNMKKARKLKGWSQEGAAKAIQEAGATGFKRSNLGAIEEGRVKSVKPALQHAIQKVYEINSWDVFSKNINYFEPDITAEELHTRLTQTDPSTRRAIKILLGVM